MRFAGTYRTIGTFFRYDKQAEAGPFVFQNKPAVGIVCAQLLYRVAMQQ